MEQLNEALLQAWMKLSASVINPRVVDELSYKESQVCHVLYRNLQQNSQSPLTATDLCAETKMLKSQMNRTLNLLEEKGIVSRSRSEADRRQVYVTMNWEAAHRYRSQHQRILGLVDNIIRELGEEQAQQTVLLLGRIADIADSHLSGK